MSTPPLFARVGRRLLRLLAPQEAAESAPDTGVHTALDGATAVAITETFLAEAACFGTDPVDAAAAGLERAWREEWARQGGNLFGQSLGGVPGHGPRAAMAAALGITLAGRRAALFLSGNELAAVTDLLAHAVGRRAPLVVHVVARAWTTHGAASGTGHAALHAVADTGAVVFVARGVQDAVDLALLARHVAEHALVPVVVAMDDAETARAVQQVTLPDAAFVREWLGHPADAIDAPTPAQRMLFGDTRARVPRWFDLERPALLGAHQPPESWALGAAAGSVFFGDHVPSLIEAASASLAKRVGRHVEPVSAWDARDAEIVLVAEGSLVEQARAATLALRRLGGPRVGVVGLSQLRPLPAVQLSRALADAPVAAVLERTAAMLPGDPPLMREVRGALGAQAPRLVSALVGLGGLPVRAADIALLCHTVLGGDTRSRVFLGVDFHHARDPFPARQVTMDALRAAYPDVARFGLRAAESLDARPEGAVTVEIHQGALDRGVADGLADRAAALVRDVAGGAIRGRAGQAGERWDGPRIDRFTWAADPFADPGDDVPCDIVVLAGARAHGLAASLSRLRHGGTVLVEVDEARGGALPAGSSAALEGRDVRVWSVDPHAGGAHADTARERLLGALAAVLRHTGTIDAADRDLVAARAGLVEEGADADARARAFEAGLRDARRLDVVVSSPAPAAEVRLPLVLRHFRRVDRTWDNVPLFWSQVGAPWRQGDANALVADPYMATGALPPLTSTFRELSAARDTLPAWQPARCTGCGKCWTACPEGAVAPAVIGPDAVLDAGAALATAAGTPVDGLSAVKRPLAQRISKELTQGADTFGAALDAAAAWVRDKGGLPADRQRAADEALAAVRPHVAHVPAATPDVFHGEPERARKGSGELLTIAINPDTCKGCQACAAACDDLAMLIEPQTPDRLAAARTVWRTWERLPDTKADTVERASAHADVGPLAGALLSRHALLAMIGGDSAEAGSGERLAVRAILALLETELQPRVRSHVATIDALRDRLIAAARDRRADDLPTDDLDGPTERLAGLRWRLAEGPDGLGRARAGIAFGGATVSSWAGAFPHNPFTVPAVVDLTGESGALARGLVEATTRAFVDDLAIVRSAQRALGDRVDIPRRWADLTDDDRASCPPIVLVGTDAAMVGDGFGRIAALLGSDLPVKVLLLADLDLGLAGRSAVDLPPDDPPGELSLLALGHRRAVVAQSSVGAHDHLARSLAAAVSWPGPALLRVHAPSPSRHGYPTERTVQRAKAAVAARVFPLFLLRPDGDGVFGTRLSLAGNPPADSATPTLADWAAGEERFAPHLVSGPSVALERAAAERERTWRTLRELAGEVTPFAEPVRAAAAAERDAVHAAALATLRSEHAAALAAARAETTAEAVVRVRERLLHLAGYR